jgi:hypothetical protein
MLSRVSVAVAYAAVLIGLVPSAVFAAPDFVQVPEPSSLTLLTIGGLAFGWWRRHK